MEIILNPNPPTITTHTNPILTLLGLCRRALFEPTRFFRHDLSQFSVSEALTFGIGNAWAAAVIAFFVQTFNTLLVSQLLDRWMKTMLSSEEGFAVWGISATSFLYSSGALMLAPFIFLLRGFFTTVWLYFFARLLIEDRPGALEPVTFKNAFRIQAVALTGHWFSIVPVFGGPLSFFVSLVLAVTGVRERFGVSTRRAFAVVVAPYFMFIFLLMLLLVVVLFGVTQVPFEDLLDMVEIEG